MRLELTKGSGHYFEVPNKRVTFLILFENLFPPPRFFTLTQIKKNVPFPRFFTYMSEKNVPLTYIYQILHAYFYTLIGNLLVLI